MPNTPNNWRGERALKLDESAVAAAKKDVADEVKDRPEPSTEGDDLAEWGYEAATPHLTQTPLPSHGDMAA